MGEETTTPMPVTPRQAMEHPDMAIFRNVTDRIPGEREYAPVIETIQWLKKQHGDNVENYLKPFWTAWSTRKTQAGKPYSPKSLVWLYEWAMNDQIPSANGHEPQMGETKTKNQDTIRKVAERARR